MASCAWTRLADMLGTRPPRACLLPVAVRPWQKVLCATAGVVALSSAVVATGYATILTIRAADVVHHRHGDRLRLLRNKIRPAQQEPVPSTSDVSTTRRVLVEAVNVGFVALTPKVVHFSASTWYRDTLASFRIMRGTTVCCDIVRHTAYVCARTPLPALVAMGWPFGSGLIITEWLNAYDRRRRT